MTKTPIESLLHNVQTRPQSTAFVFHDDAWSYERIASEAARLARALTAQGVKAGDRVALHMMNRPEMIVAYYACFQLGAIAAPLRTAFTTAELSSLLQRLAPKVYLGELNLYYSVAAIDTAILPRDKRFVLGAASDRVDPQSWNKLFDGQSLNSHPSYLMFTGPRSSSIHPGRRGSPNSSRIQPRPWEKRLN